MTSSVTVRAVVAAATALVIAGCGGGSPPQSHTTSTPADPVPQSGAPLTISPANPTTADPIDFSFTAPVAAGPDGKFRIGYSVSITGPAGNDCVGTHEASVAQVGRGATATVTVGPPQLGHPWCAGGYTARAFELQSANCTGSKPCPQFVRVVGIVARTSFTVTAAS